MASLEKTLELLDKVTDAGNRAKATLDRLTENQVRNPSQAGYQNLIDELNRVIALEEKRIALAKQANTMQATAPRQAGVVMDQNQQLSAIGNKRSKALEEMYKLEASGQHSVNTNTMEAVSKYETGVEKRIEQLRNVSTRLNEAEARIREKLNAINTAGVGAQPAHVGGGATEGAAPAFIPPTATKGAGDDINKGGKDIKSAGQILREAAEKARRDANEAFARANPDLTKFAQEHGGFTPQQRIRSISDQGGAYTEHQYRKTDEYGVSQEGRFRSDQYGNVSNAVPQKRFQSFAQGITKDLGDLVKWSIAIAAIYGPINAASEAIKTMIENESKLADVSIKLTDNVDDTARVFDDVYASAKKSGEGVGGVIDAFGAAYTAAGRISNEYQRYDATVKLLNDSLVLSKLSTLDQAGAIDVLTAALYQTAEAPNPLDKLTESERAVKALDRGTELIDQWIQVSRIASVDVATLATGVAVLGDSAETAGLSIEQLNAMVATISETSLAGGKEAANIAKALIGNYQQPGASKELNRLGIAIVDTTGKTRQFLDVMKDVAALRSAGILGDQDFARLTLALGGGGIRRQKDVSAFIENFGRMDQITKAQMAGGGGQASEALAKKLDTVQTSATQLANAFTGLAQTMGTKGGLLDVFSTTLKTGTSFVELLDKIADKAGKVSPLLMGTGIASLLLMGRGGPTGIAASLSTNTGMSMNAASMLTGARNPIANALGLGNNPYGFSTGGGAMGAAFSRATTLPSLAAIAIPAAQNLAGGDYEEAGANIAGGIAGALVGGPVGAVIGSAIAEAFVRTTLTYDTEFTNFFSGVNKATLEGAEGISGGGAKTPEELMKSAFEVIGGGNEDAGKFISWFTRVQADAERRGNPSAQYMIPGKNVTTYDTNEAAAMELLKKKDPELFAQFQSAYAQQGFVPEGEQTKLTKRQLELKNAPGSSEYLRRIQQEEQDRLKTGVITGDIKQSDYANRLSSVSAFSTTATKWMAALTLETGKLPKEFKSSESAYKEFLDILSSGNQESIDNINAYIAEIDAMQQVWDKWNPKDKEGTWTVNGTKTTGEKESLGLDIANASTALANIIQSSSNQAILAILDLPQVYGSNISGLSPADLEKVLSETKKFQDIRYQELPPETYKDLEESFDKVSFLVEEGGKLVHKTFGKIDQKILGEVFAKLQKEGAIESDTGTPWSTSTATAAQIRQAELQAPAYVAKLEQQGYKSETTDAIYSTSDESIVKAHGDQKVIQYLLQQILDTEKKQLQGVWNLPEGASFWVPLQSMIAGNGGTKDITKEASVTEAIKDVAKDPYAFMDKPKGDKWWETQKAVEAVSKYPDESEQPRMRPYVAPEQVKAAEDQTGGVIEQLMSLLKSFFGSGAPGWDPYSGSGGGKGTRGGMKTGRDVGGKEWSGRTQDQSAQKTQAINTRMDLRFTSTTQLIVDGRILANIIKPYLASDMVRSNESGGTVTRSYVI